jgi:hypothetical protein
MAVDFSRIQGPAQSATGNFEKLCAHLVALEFPDARAVEGKGGDGGVDAFIRTVPGQPGIDTVFQFKFFTDTLNSSRKRQIENSLTAAVKGSNPKQWILCIPKTLTPAEHQWWAQLTSSHSGLVNVQLWDEILLRQRLLTHSDIAEEFFPERFTDTQERQLKEIVWMRGIFGRKLANPTRRWKPMLASILAVAVTWCVARFFTDGYQIERILADAPVAEAAQSDQFSHGVDMWSAATLFYGDAQRSLEALNAVRSSPKPVALARLAAVSAELGNAGAAGRFTQESLRATADFGPEEFRLQALADVAALLGLAGQTENANRLARQVVSEVSELPPIFSGGHMPNIAGRIRFDSVRRAVQAFEIAGNITEARAATIKYLGLDKSNTQFDLFMAMGRPHRLFVVMSQSGSPYYVDWEHVVSAQTRGELGEFDAAIEEAQLIKYTPVRENTLHELSASMADRGQIEKANAIKGKGIPPNLAIAVALHRAGRESASIAMWKSTYASIKTIPAYHCAHDFMLSKASMALAQMGRLRWARNTANECKSPEMRLQAYTVILAEYTKRKRENLVSAINSIVVSDDHFTPAKP